MKVLAVDRILPGFSEDKLKELTAEEMRTAWKHYTEGTLREWYFRQDRPGAVLVLECKDLDEAREIIAELPLVREKLIDFDLIPLGPFVPLATLFA